jgi:DnaJ-class molecular chaperone
VTNDLDARRLLFEEAARKARESNPCKVCDGLGELPNMDPTGAPCRTCDGTGIELMRESSDPRKEAH